MSMPVVPSIACCFGARTIRGRSLASPRASPGWTDLHALRAAMVTELQAIFDGVQARYVVHVNTIRPR